ncbi:hypothetical protein VdG1_00390 [Verticillium dahliae VDG1]|nr:hypothetical protein VdG1_00390 [Verticillium dahliae VDG1]
MPVRSTVNACTKPFMSPDSITYLGLTHSGAYTRPTAAKTDTQPSGSPSSSASSDDLSTGPTGAEYFPHRPKSLAGIALRAFLLDAALSVSALGAVLVLGNVLSLAGYAFVLWKFFSGRIRHEEELLVRFFGREYEEYRRRVGTRMPFCG